MNISGKGPLKNTNRNREGACSTAVQKQKKLITL
jgi:hypothetical protein